MIFGFIPVVFLLIFVVFNYKFYRKTISFRFLRHQIYEIEASKLTT